ncbi:MAG: enoyl-CoA hydratase/isomerase family protein, partial [Gammaproteobacteria bacterium]
MTTFVDAVGFLRACHDPEAVERWSAVGENAAGCVVVDLAQARRSHPTFDPGHYSPPFCVVIGLSERSPAPSRDATGTLDDPALPDWVDVAVSSPSALDALLEPIARQPVAAATLTGVLRLSQTLPVADALRAESLAYSTLQHGADFERWLATRRAPSAAAAPAATPALVHIERAGSQLTLTLNRPDRRNAYSAAMRDALCEGLELALADTGLTDIVLRGHGSAFCAGGDLTEFGLARDGAIAHGSRVTRSAGWL